LRLRGLALDLLLALSVLGLLAAIGCTDEPGEPAGAGSGAPPVGAPAPDLAPAPDAETTPTPGPAPALRPTDLITIPAGTHYPLYPGKDEPEEAAIEAFQLERHPVTNEQFLAFVWAEPQWRRSRIAGLFADDSYLRHWSADLEFDDEHRDAPVTQVSWFAVRAYAEWVGRRLPTLAEWEYVAAASEDAALGREEEGYNQRILTWYSRPTGAVLRRIESAEANYYGLHDLHGLIWEWVDDFNTALVTGESRGDSGLDRNLFCGSGSIGAADPQDYAAFMRFAFRSSLEARYSVNNLGFRCAAPAQETRP